MPPFCPADARSSVRSMNNTSRHLMDRDFLLHNPVYRDLVMVGPGVAARGGAS